MGLEDVLSMSGPNSKEVSQLWFSKNIVYGLANVFV